MISKKYAIEAWKESLRYILENGVEFQDEYRRTCREVFNLLIRIESQEDITKPIKILNEFKNWKYPPLEEISKVILSNKLAPDYAYSYGPRIFNFQKKIDQVNDFIIPLLKEKPSSRKATITLLDPVEDSNMVKRDIPGLVTIDFKLRQGKLNITAVIRSNDMFFGWPANIYQLFVLQDYVRKKLGCDAGKMDTFSISAHVFNDQKEYIDRVMNEF
jgi:thymidylate synthase